MADKKNILLIDNSVHVTGALKSITRSAYDLRSFFEFSFIIPQNSQGRFWIESKGFDGILELPMHELSRRIYSVLVYFPFLIMNAIKLNRILRKYSIDMIHVNDLYNLMPVVTRIFGNNVPYICNIRFLPDRFPKVLMKFWLNLHFIYAEKIIVVSEKVKQQLPAHLKIIVIPNELPIEERYFYTPSPSTFKSSYTFLYLSNFMTGKGHSFALEAFAQIHQQLPKWKLRFVGGDMGMKKNRIYRDGLIAKGNAMGLEKKIEWLGFTEDVELEYKQGDIVLNFSESESFSITCLEAMYYGRPLIATDCGGPAEIIDHLETGILVPNREVSAMAEAMKTLACDSNLRLAIARNARTVVKERFSVKNTSHRLKQIYNAVCPS